MAANGYYYYRTKAGMFIDRIGFHGEYKKAL